MPFFQMPRSLPAPLKWPSLVVFLVVVVGGGLAIGALTGPGEWFLQLRKPSFNPPNWLFGPVWTLLYVLIAIAGWRVWRRQKELGPLPMSFWVAQLLLNFLWSPVFFGAHRIGLALGVIVVLLLCILAFIVSTARRDGTAALLFVPYAAWVSFATALNAAFLALNPST
jgi:benzodiazapine receptor